MLLVEQGSVAGQPALPLEGSQSWTWFSVESHWGKHAD